MPTQNLLRLLLLLMLMMRIVLATVCCRFGRCLVIKLNFCSDFDHKVWKDFEVGVWSVFCRGSEVESWSRFLSQVIPDICHGRHRRRPCKFFLPGVNFYRFNAKNRRFFTDLTRKVGFFFTHLTRKIGVFRCKFHSPKILPV